jgi:hypothetical protein
MSDELKTSFFYSLLITHHFISLSGPVAQMKRAAGFYPAVRGFKSYQARQIFGARIAKSGQRHRSAKPTIVSSNLTACSTLLINKDAMCDY